MVSLTSSMSSSSSSSKKAAAVSHSDAGHGQFVDKVVVEVKGGRGGAGCVSFDRGGGGGGPGARGARKRQRPDGGDGGAGGDVYVRAATGTGGASLSGATAGSYQYFAEDGAQGGAQLRTGRRGKDTVLEVPVGTVVREVLTVHVAHRYDDDDDEDDDDDDDADDRLHRGDTAHYHEGEADDNIVGDDRQDSDGDAEERRQRRTKKKRKRRRKKKRRGQQEGEPGEAALLPEDPPHQQHSREVDLDTPGDTLLVARGGLAGIGNRILARARHRSAFVGHRQPGEVGDHRYLELELKLLADVGLVGFPNAGKSTLLRALSRARPKVAPYPFTTLHPMLGTVEFSDLEHLTVADIPGLIEGAHEDRGMGHEFLRHVERTHVLLYVLDMAQWDRDPVDDLHALVREVELYSPDLLDKRCLIAANKMDDEDGIADWGKIEDNLQRLHENVHLLRNPPVLEISAKTGHGMPALAATLRNVVKQVKESHQHSQEKESRKLELWTVQQDADMR